MLAGAHHLLALTAMHLGRRGQDHRVGALDALGEIAAQVGNAVFLGDLSGGVLIAADQRHHLDLRDALQGVEMLLAERALAGDANLHHLLLSDDFILGPLRSGAPALARLASEPAFADGAGVRARTLPRRRPAPCFRE